MHDPILFSKDATYKICLEEARMGGGLCTISSLILTGNQIYIFIWEKDHVPC